MIGLDLLAWGVIVGIVLLFAWGLIDGCANGDNASIFVLSVICISAVVAAFVWALSHLGFITPL